MSKVISYKLYVLSFPEKVAEIIVYVLIYSYLCKRLKQYERR